MTEHLNKLVAEAEQWRRDHPWLSRWYGLRRRTGKAWRWLKRQPRHRWERARRGFSYMDAWGFDLYIAGVIADACDHLRKVRHGRPVDMTEAEWDAYLDSVAGPLHRYGDGDPDATYDEDAAAYTDAVAAMHRFADKFGSFWD
ncbi:hypothetical protein [Streptomyces sp. R44]|uniref:Uncharacterized protein n=1 Tax=Streptomyces sp. R44 TaxID=3238633 RepID=A0AB39TA71_9ACTN